MINRHLLQAMGTSYHSGIPHDIAASLIVFTARCICIVWTMPWQDVCPSICLSVCLSHASIVCKWLYISWTFFSPLVSPTIVFPYQTRCQYSDGDPPNGGAECKGGMNKSWFATNIELYLGTDARYSHSYYGRRIGNRTQTFEWYNFEWPWVTSNPDFKVTILFNVK